VDSGHVARKFECCVREFEHDFPIWRVLQGSSVIEQDLARIVRLLRFPVLHQLISKLWLLSDVGRSKMDCKAIFLGGHCCKEGQYLHKDVSQGWWSKSDWWYVPKRTWSSIVSITTVSTITISTISTLPPHHPLPRYHLQYPPIS